MNERVQEYKAIAEYVSRIDSVSRILNKFSSIQNIPIEEEKLKRDIDQTLVALISRCDAKEEPLRQEERYLQAVRYFDGDTEAAKSSVLEAERRRAEETVNLVSQMTNIIIQRDEAHPSERKTSVNFLSSYIRKGFQEYMAEKKPAFPKQITIKVDSWTGTTESGEDAEALHSEFKAHMQQERNQELARVKLASPMQRAVVFGIWAAVSIFLFLQGPVLGILGVAATLIYGLRANKITKTKKDQVREINTRYDEKLVNGKKSIDAVLSEWRRAKEMVRAYESNEVTDIVA